MKQEHDDGQSPAGFKGGQGRPAEAVEDAANAAFVVFCFAVAFGITALIVWAVG